MRSNERHPLEGGLPFLHEVQRNNVRIVKEKLADYVDPPRFYPLIGPAQQHHAHYKCTVYYTEVTRVGWPLPHTLRDEDAREVIYVDHNHFHMVGNVRHGRLGRLLTGSGAAADETPIGRRTRGGTFARIRVLERGRA